MLMETPSSPPPEHRSLVGFVLRLTALTLVGGLLALLVWRVVNAGQGGRLVTAVREHKKPIAPDFRLGVLWPHAETWPRSTRGLATSKVELRSLRGGRSCSTFGRRGASPARTRHRGSFQRRRHTKDRRCSWASM